MAVHEYVRDKDVAKLMGFSVQSIRNQRYKGWGPPYYKIGRSIRYKFTEVIAYIEARKVVPVYKGRACELHAPEQA